MLFLVHALEIEVEDVGEVVILHRSGQQHLERVAEEGDGMMVVRELRILGEDAALLRLLDVRLEGDESVLARRLEDFVQDLQQLAVGRLVERVRLEQRDGCGNRRLDDARRIGHDERAEARPTDDDEFGGLPQHAHLAVVHGVSGDDAAEDDGETDELKHDDIDRED